MAKPVSVQITFESGHFRPLDEIEAEIIDLAVKHYDNQMSEVARALQIGRSTLYRKTESRAGISRCKWR